MALEEATADPLVYADTDALIELLDASLVSFLDLVNGLEEEGVE